MCNFFNFIFFRVKRQFFQSFAPGAVHSTVNCVGTKEGCSQMKLDGVRTFQIDEEEEQVGLRTSQTVEPRLFKWQLPLLKSTPLLFSLRKPQQL